MNNIVNFEIAKLLKEKGYDTFTQYEYSDIGRLVENRKYIQNRLCSAPTIAEVVMWLYDKHGIWISVTKYKDIGDDVNDPYHFTFDNGKHIHKTPTEAYGIAILYTLQNLI